jgi:hypothetical protein
MMLRGGTREQITWRDGNWLFLDIGFSANKSSSGLLIGDGEAHTLQFGEAKQRIVEHVKRATSPTSLVIEAPLSVCFNRSGNPTGRLIERESVEGKTKTRYWHAGLGCSVMLAAMYLIRDIAGQELTFWIEVMGAVKRAASPPRSPRPTATPCRSLVLARAAASAACAPNRGADIACYKGDLWGKE